MSKKTIGGFIDWELRDPKGRIVKRGKQPIKSWVKQWIQVLYAAFSNTNTSILDTNGTSRTVASSLMTMQAGAGVTSYGIVVGSSDTPVTRDDYRLGSQIAHGSGTGQLMYSAMSHDAPTPYSTGYLTRAMRVFTNNSGGDVTVKEVGVVIYYTNNPYYFLIIRDVLSTPVTIPNGYSWTVRYNFYFVV
jgi:hypothetical protein